MKKALSVVAVLLLALIVFGRYEGAQIAAAPHGDVPVPASQADVFSRESWLQDSPDHVILSYDLRSPSSSMELDVDSVRSNMTRTICASPDSHGRKVGVVVNEPDGSTFTSFEANCQ